MSKSNQAKKSNDSIFDDLIVIAPELVTKLKVCDFDVRQYIAYLETEIKKLHRRNLSLIAKHTSINLRIKALEEHYTNCDECNLKLIERAEEKLRDMIKD